MSQRTVKLSEISNIYSGGGAPQNQNDFTENGTPFIRAGSLIKLLNGTTENDLEKLGDSVARKHRLIKHKSNSVVFAKSGMSATKGHIYRLKNDCFVVNHLAIIEPNKNIEPSYLEHVLKVVQPTKLILDVAYPSIRLGDIANFEIPLPPLAEQKRIAAILDKANEIKAKRELALSKLDDFEDSIFNKMFEQSSNAQASLKEICEFKYGKSLPSEKRISGKIKVYGSNGVVGSHETALTKGPTIIVGRKGSYGEINFSDVSCFPIDTTYYIDSTASKQNLVWLAKALSKLGLNKMNKSAAVPGLSREDAYRQLVKLPSLQKQIEFEEITKRINHERDKYRLFLSESIALNQSLQNQAFTTGFNA